MSEYMCWKNIDVTGVNPRSLSVLIKIMSALSSVLVVDRDDYVMLPI